MKKFLTIVLLSVFVSTMAFTWTGCKKERFKSDHAPRYVEDDGEPWYQVTTTDMMTDNDIFSYDYCNFDKLYSDDDEIQIIETLFLNNGYNQYYLHKYDLNGSLIYSKDLSKLCFGEDAKPSTDVFYNVIDVDSENGFALMQYQDYKDYLFYSQLAIYDAKSGEVSVFDSIKGLLLDNVYISNAKFIDKDHFYICVSDFEGGLFVDEVKNREIIKSIDLSKKFNCSSDDLFCEFNGDSLLVYVTSDNSVTFTDGSIYLNDKTYVYDLETEAIEEMDYYNDAASFYMDEEVNGKTIRHYDDKIVAIDASGKETVMCDYEHSNVNPTLLYHDATVVACDDDSIKLLAYSNASVGNIYIQKPCLMTINRLDKNPYVGRQLIYIDIVDEYNDINLSWLFSAMDSFNKNNDEYFIQIQYDDGDTAYDVYGDTTGFTSENEYIAYDYECAGKFEDILRDKYDSDNGPDLVFGATANFDLLQNGYFEDLFGVLKQEYGAKSYLTNVIEGCKINGSLYYMPVAFQVEGISVNTPGKSGVGLTYTEYAMSVFKDFGGTDPLSMTHTRASYFMHLFSSQYLDYIDENDELSIDNADFKALVDYCKNDVKDYTMPDFFSYEQYTDYNEKLSYADNIYCFEQFLDKTMYGQSTNKSVVGYPSDDGQGPVIDITASFSIAKSSGSKDGCWEFIRYVLDHESEIEFVGESYLYFGIPIMIDTIRKNCEEVIEQFNNDPKAVQFEIYNNLTKSSSIDSNSIDEFLLFLDSCSKVNYQDPNINFIVFDEITKYFEGDIDYNKLVSETTERCNSVIKDRKSR